MRKIQPKAIVLFSMLTILNVLANATLCFLLYQFIKIPQQFLYFIMPISFFISNTLTFRGLFHYLKFPLNKVEKDSPEDFAFQMYVIYYLIFFNFFVHNSFLPVPISRLFHQMLGAKFGPGSYSAGHILDPSYVEIGSNTLIGFGAVLTSHALEGENVIFEKIIVGNHVTIGLNAIVMPGVTIEDNAIIAAGALITKNTYIKNGEVWGGIPGKKLKDDQDKIISPIISVA